MKRTSLSVGSTDENTPCKKAKGNNESNCRTGKDAVKATSAVDHQTSTKGQEGARDLDQPLPLPGQKAGGFDMWIDEVMLHRLFDEHQATLAVLERAELLGVFIEVRY